MSKISFYSFNETELRAEKAWWRLYESCFPPSERESKEVILRSLNGDGMVFGTYDQDKLIGISTIHLLRDTATVFLIYLAIDNDYRGKGIGARLLTFTFSQGIERLNSLGLTHTGNVWEVERPDQSEEQPDIVCREKRIGFFKKNNGVLLDVNYIQPPVDGKTLVPMYLMFQPSQAYSIELITENYIRKLIKSIYHEKYRDVNGIDQSTLDKLLSKI